jgi:hypothetical protein
MYFVHEVEPGKMELAYMWLPTWLGMNSELKRQVEAHIRDKFVGKEATIEDLHKAVIDFYCDKFPSLNLRGYLEAVEGVEINGTEG